MTTLNSRLQLALLNRKQKSNKGFTLVELMIVIVIVGILAAIALPNFLNQTKKAKGTEAKSDQSSIMKNASAEFQQGGSNFVTTLIGGTYTDTTTFSGDGDCDDFGARTAAATTKFDYVCSIEPITNARGAIAFADSVAAGSTVFDGTADPAQALFLVTAVADGTDSGLGTEVITFAINLNNGHTELVRTGTCTAFGGSVSGAAPAAASMAVNADTNSGFTATCP